MPCTIKKFIFAHLSIRDLTRISCIKKEWRADVRSYPYFQELCNTLQNKTLEFLSFDCGSYWIQNYNLYSNKWAFFKLVLKPTLFTLNSNIQ